MKCTFLLIIFLLYLCAAVYAGCDGKKSGISETKGPSSERYAYGETERLRRQSIEDDRVFELSVLMASEMHDFEVARQSTLSRIDKQLNAVEYEEFSSRGDMVIAERSEWNALQREMNIEGKRIRQKRAVIAETRRKAVLRRASMSAKILKRRQMTRDILNDANASVQPSGIGELLQASRGEYFFNLAWGKTSKKMSRY